MSKREAFVILDAQNAATFGDSGKKEAQLCPQNVVRRKLADISNLPLNQRPLIQEEKSQSIETTKESIDQLQRENMALVKMLAQRNKIIEQSGIELDRLRVNLLKMQEQNHQLALSNTQMLADLNSGKDRLRVLQHELGCKGGLLKAKKLELEGRARTKQCKNANAELIKSRVEGEFSKEAIDDEKPLKAKRSLQSSGLVSSEQAEPKDKIENKRPFVRRQSARFKAAEVKPAEDMFKTNSTEVSASELSDDKDKAENKRPFMRRQSARLKAAEVNPAEDMFETDGTKVSSSAPDDTVREQGSNSESSSVKIEGNIVSSGLKYESQEFGRSSLSRPSRVAAKKVQSYKEVPLNVKMRRSE